MSISKYCLTWDSHKNNVCSGFANLQQNEELVDMTLAADGYLVNVHKTILALASPYIRSMLQSTPTPHPVIFLSNISHEILNYILAYVYTGEVYVEVEKIQSFMKAAKDLRLSGLCNVPAPMVKTAENNGVDRDATDIGPNVIPNAVNPVTASNDALLNNMPLNVTLPTTQITMNNANFDFLDTEQHTVPSEVNELPINQITENNAIDNIADNRESGLYTTNDGYQYRLEIPNVLDNPTESVFNSIGTSNEISETIKVQNVGAKNEMPHAPLPTMNTDSMSNSFGSIKGTLDPKTFTPQYTVSSRGSLQLIFNRYMYYCHHQSQGGRKRRWRCIDYRRTHCPAFIDTDCEVMTIRKFVHVHSFHDDKIRKKMKRNTIFTNLNCVMQKLNTDKSQGDMIGLSP